MAVGIGGELPVGWGWKIGPALLGFFGFLGGANDGTLFAAFGLGPDSGLSRLAAEHPFLTALGGGILGWNIFNILGGLIKLAVDVVSVVIALIVIAGLIYFACSLLTGMANNQRAMRETSNFRDSGAGGPKVN